MDEHGAFVSGMIALNSTTRGEDPLVKVKLFSLMSSVVKNGSIWETHVFAHAWSKSY